MNIWKRYSMRVSKNWVKFNKMFTLSPWMLITFWLILRIRMFERVAQANYFLETQFIGDQ